MPLLLGLLSTAIAAAVSIAAEAYLGFGPHSFYMMFIIPVGAFLVGVVGGLGYHFGLLWTNRPPNLRHTMVAGLLALVGWAAIYVGIYSLTYVTEDAAGNVDVNYSFKGEHISHYATVDDEPVTFWVYLKTEVSQREYSFFNHGAKIGSVGDSTPVPFLNWILFSLEGLGIVAGGVAGGAGILGDRKYCARCEQYMKRRRAVTYRMADHEHMQEAINQALNAPDTFGAFVQAHQGDKAPGNEAHVCLDVAYCPHCHDGQLLVQFMTKPGKYGLTEDTHARQTVHLDAALVLGSMRAS